jgi:flagellar biosynthesis protein FlhG
MPQTIAVTSGKGGVGKTNISINLAIQLARQGLQTCLFDADLGLANIDILLGVYPEFNLSHVIDGQKRLTEILVRDYGGVDIVPGSTGIARLTNLTEHQINPVIASISALDSYDIILFDTSAGADGDVTAFCRAASQVLLVITPEPSSLTDAYSLLKILCAQQFDKPVWVIVNQTRNQRTAQVAFLGLSRTVARHLGLSLSLVGFINHDPLVTEAVKRQRPFTTIYPKTIASACIRDIADRLISEMGAGIFPTDMYSFWRTFVEPPPGSRPLPTPARPLSLSGEPAKADGRDLREIKEHLSVIETQINAIINVMASLEKRLRGQQDEPGTPITDGPQIEPIVLDFEAYLAQRTNRP